MSKPANIHAAIALGDQTMAGVREILEALSGAGIKAIMNATAYMNGQCGNDPDELVRIVMPAGIVKLIGVFANDTVVRFLSERACTPPK